MKPIYIILTDDDAAGILAGKQTQIRVEAMRYDTRRPEPTIYTRLKPGDLIWCKERYTTYRHRFSSKFAFVYGDDRPPKSIGEQDVRTHRIGAERMRREESRLTLEVVSIKQEMLFAISAADALASGIVAGTDQDGHAGFLPIAPRSRGCFALSPEVAYLNLWDLNHVHHRGDRTRRMVAITFAAHKVNVDALLSSRGVAA